MPQLKQRPKPNEVLRQSVVVNGAKRSANDPNTVIFERPQVITNGMPQKDGSYYDIPTLDVENYNGKVYDDHFTGWRNVLGRVIGLSKNTNAPNGGEVTIEGIAFSPSQVKNGEAQLAIDMLLEGLIEFSTGTYGYTDYESGERKNHRLVELSLVGLGNNDYTDSSDNSLQAVAARNGLDLSKYQLNGTDNQMKTKVKNHLNQPVEVSYQNEHGETVKQTLAAGESIDLDNAQAEAVQAQINAARPNPLDEKGQGSVGEQPKGDGKPSESDDKKGSGSKGKDSNAAPTLADYNILHNQLQELQRTMNTPLKPQAGAYIDHNRMSAPGGSSLTEKVKNMSAGERLARQIMLERSEQKNSSEYQAINAYNQEEALAKNAEKYANYFSTESGSLGGLVPPYELLDRITGCSTNYDNLLQSFPFEEMGLSYGWNSRLGDIDFTPLEACAPSPEDDFGVQLQLRTQERLAAHSVICNKATRFTAANVLNLVSQRYQVAYKRNLARMLVAELELAVDRRVAGYLTVAGDPNGSLTYPGSDATARYALVSKVFTDLADCVDNGLMLMNSQTANKLIIDLGITSGNAGALSNGQVSVRNYNALAVALGSPVLIVPRDLMPTLGSGGTVVIPRTADGGGNVTVQHAIFYVARENWQGATSGGLAFDVDSFGSYEVSVVKAVAGGGGGTVTVTETRSAKQRGETVLFGEMWRGGGILDWREVGGVLA